jgi:hypothetical protein
LHVIGNEIRFSNSANTSYYGTISHDASTTGNNIYNVQDTGGHVFQLNGTEKTRIDSSGRLLVGTSTARSNFFNTTASAALQIEGTATARRASIISCEAASDTGGSLVLAHQRSGAGGGNTIVNNGDIVGRLSYQGNDGAEFVEAASINCEIDGTPGANDMPGRLVFSTTSDGASSPTERLRIDSSGRVGIGTQSPGSALHVVGVALFNTAQSFIANSATGSVGTFQYNGTSIGDIGSGNQTLSGGSTGDVALTSRAGALVFGINTVEKARIDSSGRLLVGTSSSSAEAKFVVQGGSTASGGGVNIQRNATTASAGQTIGFVDFTNSSNNVGARILAEGDGTWTAGTSHPTRLVFSTTADGASSPTERMRITSDAYVRLASGTGGIQFNGDTAAANALDDYEEGTFTPIDSSGAGLSFTSTSGHYTKVGNICYVSGALTFPSTANTNSIIIGGLPFFPSTGTQYQNFGPPIRNNKSLDIQSFGVNNTTFLVLPIGGYTTYTTNSQMSGGTMQFSYTYQTA